MCSRSPLSAITNQEYDFLAKVIIIGPSGVGKLCILHRFIKNEWNILASQTIGVEFSSKIVSIGPLSNHVKMKLQLWDTAGQERFRSLTRLYYRGSAGVVLVYDVTDRKSFDALHEFMVDVRSLTNETVLVAVVGNKSDLVEHKKGGIDPTTLVLDEEALLFCAQYLQVLGYEIPFIKCSALLADNVGYIFDKLANMVLSKVEMGVIDPEDPLSGVQYGDFSRWDIQSTSSGIERGRRKGRSQVNLEGEGGIRWLCC